MLCLDQCSQKFINKTLQGGKRLLFNSDPWPPAEQKLEMPCDTKKVFHTCHRNAIVKIIANTHIPPNPNRCSVLLPALSTSMAETNVIMTFTTPVPIVAYCAAEWDRPALSNILVE